MYNNTYVRKYAYVRTYEHPSIDHTHIRPTCLDSCRCSGSCLALLTNFWNCLRNPRISCLTVCFCASAAFMRLSCSAFCLASSMLRRAQQAHKTRNHVTKQGRGCEGRGMQLWGCTVMNYPPVSIGVFNVFDFSGQVKYRLQIRMEQSRAHTHTSTCIQHTHHTHHTHTTHTPHTYVHTHAHTHTPKNPDTVNKPNAQSHDSHTQSTPTLLTLMSPRCSTSFSRSPTSREA